MNLATLETLLTKAETAKPVSLPRGKWAPLYPVYAKLCAKGFKRDEAVEWLVSEGVIPKSDSTKAKNALIQIHFRVCRRAGGTD
jgi:hypothetical protein